MNDRDWFPPAALLLLQAQLRVGGPVPENEVAKLWTVPRIKVPKCVEYLRSVGFQVSKVIECRLAPSGMVRKTGDVSYYIGRLEDASDVRPGCAAAAGPSGEEGGSSLPQVWQPPMRGHEHQGRRRRRP